MWIRIGIQICECKKTSFTRIFTYIFCTIKNWIQCIPMALFTHIVKKIKGAVHKNGDVDDTCKRPLSLNTFIII